MRTNIVINDKLMQQALHSSGLSTKKAAVEAGLRLLIQLKDQAALREARGKLKWKGNLDAMRTDK